jgi:hypothetical protein
MAGVVDQLDIGDDIPRRPAPRHQPLARLGRIGRGADGRNHLVHVGNRHRQTAQDMAALARLAQFIGGAAGDNFFAEGDEMAQEIGQRQLFGTAPVQRQHVAAERGLHRRKAVKLVQYHIRRGIAFELDHHAHADPVGFVLHMGDALDLLFAHLFGDFLDHRRLVHLIGNLVDDDGETVLADFLYPRFGADDDRAAPLKIGFARA